MWHSERRMKPSGIGWVGDIPEEWDVVRLKRTVAGCSSGIWGDEPDGENDLICVRVADFDRHQSRVVLDKPTMRAILPEQRNGRILNRGDLLLEKSGGGEQQPVGVVVLYDHDEPAVCSNFVARMPVMGGHHPTFLCYLFAALYTRRLNVRSIKQTTGIQNLDSESYLNESVPIPPHAEQSLIVEYLGRKLSAIDAIIRKKERLIELLQEKRQAVISRAVTRGLDPTVPMKDSGIEWLGDVPSHWKVLRIATVSDKITNGYVGPTRDLFLEDGIKYLQSLHIKANQIRFSPEYFVSPTWSAGKPKSVLRCGDVLIVQTGDIGQVTVVPKEFEGANCHALIIVSGRPECVCGDYLSWVLNSNFGFHSLKSIQTGALHPHLNCTLVRELFVPVPPLNEQRQICNHIKHTTAKLIQIVTMLGRQIDLLREYRQTLISNAVSGKIDVRQEALTCP